MRIAVLVALAAAPAWADVRSEDVAKAATALFEQGRQLLDAGKHDEACDKFEASLRLDPQIGTKLNVAACREDKGKYLEAYRIFDECARDDAKTPGKETRLDFERQRMAKLLPKLVRLKLKVTAPGVTGVQLDKQPLAPAEWTGETIVAPGPVVVTIVAPGRAPIRIERTGTAGGELAIGIAELPAIGEHQPPPPPPETPTGRRHKRAVWILAGVTGGAWVTSFCLGLHAKIRADRAVENNDAELSKSAFRESDIGTGFFIAGAISAAAGVTVYFFDRKATVAPTMTAGGIGLGVAGAF